ncbi:MAG: hypothetical protein ACRDRR_17820 [Pseudonocardiaceae bacterium]
MGQHEPEGVGCLDEQPAGVDHETEGLVETGFNGVQLNGPFGDDLLGGGDVGSGYRDLARALYALALDVVRAQDVERAKQVCEIISAGLEPMARELGIATPGFEMVEYTDLASIRNWTGDR